MSTSLYFVPWVTGPSGVSRPFALTTKYGDLVFAFVSKDELYQCFFDQSAADLPQAFTLEDTAVAVAADDQLQSTLAASVPTGLRVGVVRQGTDGFEQMIGELADGSIWPEGGAGSIAAWCLTPSESTTTKQDSGIQQSKERLEFLDADQEKRKVFLSYVREDRDRVEQLASALGSANIPVWIDTSELLPGSRWRDEIRNAIRQGACFLVVFSKNSESRDRTYMREELALAVEETRLRRRDVPWLVPVLLDDVPLPDYPLGPGERLSDLQAAILYQDWDKGVHGLTEVLRSSLGLDVSTGDIEALLLDLVNRQVMAQSYSLRIECADGTIRYGVPKHLELAGDASKLVVGTAQGDLMLDSHVPARVRVLHD